MNEIQLIRAQLEVERERAQAIAARLHHGARAGRAGGPEQRLAARAVPAGVRGLPGVRARLVRGARPAPRGAPGPHTIRTTPRATRSMRRSPAAARSRDALEKLEAAFAGRAAPARPVAGIRAVLQRALERAPRGARGAARGRRAHGRVARRRAASMRTRCSRSAAATRACEATLPPGLNWHSPRAGAQRRGA